MKTSNHPITTLLASSLLCVISQAAPEAAAPSAQKSFDTPQQAAASFQVPALKEILGPDSEDIVASEDPVMDKKRAVAFAGKAKEKQTIEIDPENPNQATLSVGEDAFPMPIPIIKKDGKWSFDTAAGREEILNRRIGANELDAITICRGYVEAQHEYAATNHDGAMVHQYAQRIISTPGKRDGLAWKNADGTWEGPVGENIAKALEQGYPDKGKPQPYHGYLFKVPKQGRSSLPVIA